MEIEVLSLSLSLSLSLLADSIQMLSVSFIVITLPFFPYSFCSRSDS
jgi:Co/Zn/Cd efflux system component